MERKLAKDIVVGDYINMQVPNPDYPDPSDCELNLVEVELIEVADGKIECYTYVPANPCPEAAPFDGERVLHHLDSFEMDTMVRVWTEEEVNAHYQQEYECYMETHYHGKNK